MGEPSAARPRAAGCRRPISSRRGRASSPRSRRRSTTTSPSTGITSTRWSGRSAASRPTPTSGRFFDPEEPFATCAELAAAQRAVDRRLIDACAALTDAQLALPVPVHAPRGHRGRDRHAAPRASVPAPDPPSRAGARDARRHARSSRRSSTNSSARTRPTCARRSSPSWGFRRRRSGSAALGSSAAMTPALHSIALIAPCSGPACSCLRCRSTSSRGRTRPPTPRSRSRWRAAGTRRASSARTPRARDAGIRPGQLVSASLALAPDLVLRDRDPDAEVRRARSRRDVGDAVHAGRRARAARRRARRDRRQPAALRRPAATDGAARPRRARPGLRRAARARAHARRGAAVRARGKRGRHDFRSPPAVRGCRIVARRSRPAGSRSLPLALAEADPAAVATLAAAGITTFGQACALPRAALARRVGADFVAILDRVRGLVPDPRPPFVPPPRYAGKLDLPAPVASVEALAFAVNRLVHELAGWLTGRGLGVVEMSLALAHERYVGVATGVPATTVRFALAAPAREPAHLVAVLRERLARVALPAPVEAITLASEATAPLAGRNLGLLPGDDAGRDRAAARPPARAAGRGRGDARRAARRASARARVATNSRVGLDCSGRSSSPKRPRRRRRSRSLTPTLPAAAPVWLLAEPEPLGHLLEAQPWVLRDGPGADRVGLVGRRRRAPRLLRRREPARRDGVDLSRSPLRDRRRRVVPARGIPVTRPGGIPARHDRRRRAV